MARTISLESKGDWSKTFDFLKKAQRGPNMDIVKKFADEGLAALISATPVESGKTADSWGYNVYSNSSGLRIEYTNSNVNDGVNIAILIQYGHATRNGGWVEGRDYINPAIVPVFDSLADALWTEVVEA